MDQLSEEFEEERGKPDIGERIKAARERAGLSLAHRMAGVEPPVFSGRTAIGAMGRYVAAENRHFQPMNCAFGLIDPLEYAPGQKRIRSKQERYERISERALAEIDGLLRQMEQQPVRLG